MRCYRCDPAGVRDGPMCPVCLTEDVIALRQRVQELEKFGPAALRMMALAALKKGVFKDARAEARAKEIAEAILAWSEGK